MLGDATIEFKTEAGCLHARATKDDRWYKVQGITRTLDAMTPQKCKGHHNMINMDLFTRVLQDLHRNPDSKLDWVVDYVKSLNVSERKASELRAGVLRLFASNKVPSLSACRRLWDKARMSTHIGVAVDADCKDVFNGKKNRYQVGPMSQLILAQLEALRLHPIRGGLRVACIPSPDQFSVATRQYTYHNRCTAGCKSVQKDWGFYTKIDMVAYDTVAKKMVLLELKTRHNDVLDRATIWRYNTQLWLTWLMFAITYPSIAERTTAYLVIVRPGTSVVHIRNCMKPTVSKTMRLKFPWLTCFCMQVLNCLTPTCMHMKFQDKKSDKDTIGTKVDPLDLCYRNIRFNDEKKRNRRLHDQAYTHHQPTPSPTDM